MSSLGLSGLRMVALLLALVSGGALAETGFDLVKAIFCQR